MYMGFHLGFSQVYIAPVTKTHKERNMFTCLWKSELLYVSACGVLPLTLSAPNMYAICRLMYC